MSPSEALALLAQWGITPEGFERITQAEPPAPAASVSILCDADGRAVQPPRLTGEGAATTAERIAALLHDDGRIWQADDGRSLAELCEGADVEHHANGRTIRYGFADGSAIIAADGGWDVGIPGAACHCWAGADDGRHADGCDEVAP